jgi:N-acetylmuramoyl-L-alanine amidase
LFFFFLSHGVDGQNDVGKIKCVCIDAGHGGKDPGAVGATNYEKDIVLKVALRLGQLIGEKNPDIKVVYTRDKDVFIDLNKRGSFANDHKADLFISIHTNSFDDKRVEGIETYVLGLHQSEANLRVAMKENAVIKYEDDYSVKYDGFDPSRAESYIIFSMMQNLYIGQSLNIASLVQEGLIQSTRKSDRGVRQAGFVVLKDVAMPAVLVELGYISNPTEERFLASKVEQEKITQSLLKAFQKYKETVEKNSNILTHDVHSEVENMLFEEQLDTFFYAIQIASASSKMTTFPEVKHMNEKAKINEIYTGKRYCYYIGKTATYSKAKHKLEDIKSAKGDGFIIAVCNGKMISVAEAMKLEAKKK